MNLNALKKCRLKIEEIKSNTLILFINIDKLATQSHTGHIITAEIVKTQK